MTEPRAQRTLVKSPPELWSEVSDPGALSRHLGGFGEIRITRIDPESTVAWEGDRVRGTVEIEASGWGTKVTLTAQDIAPVVPLAEEVAAPVTASARAAAPLPAPSSPPPAPRQTARRRPGLLARFRRLPRGAVPLHAAPTASGGGRPSAATQPDFRPPTPAASAPAPAAPAPALAPAPDPQAVEALLVRVLDELGSAQKRPFSR